MKRLVALAVFATALVFAPVGPAQAVTCPTVGTTSTPFNLAAGSHGHLDESSGVVASTDYTNTQTVWDHEDGGGGPYVYAHNGNTGALRATVTLSGLHNGDSGDDQDWEDIAIARTTGADTVVISDTGNNNAPTRSDVQLVAFTEPDPANGDVTLTSSQYSTYPLKFVNTAGGSEVHPNVEAMVIDQGGGSTKEVLFFAKTSGSTFAFYSAGQFNSLSTTTDNEAVKQGTITAGASTGPVAADISVDRNYLILKNYGEGMLWPRDGSWITTLTNTPTAPCSIATGSGKYEGVAFSYDTDTLFQVKDDQGCGCDTPLKQQSFTP